MIRIYISGIYTRISLKLLARTGGDMTCMSFRRYLLQKPDGRILVDRFDQEYHVQFNTCIKCIACNICNAQTLTQAPTPHRFARFCYTDQTIGCQSSANKVVDHKVFDNVLLGNTRCEAVSQSLKHPTVLSGIVAHGRGPVSPEISHAPHMRSATVETWGLHVVSIARYRYWIYNSPRFYFISRFLPEC